MRRLSTKELEFYDRLADRISGILGDRACPLNQSSLAERIGWNRASLCNFVNRVDKGIAAHFIPKIATTLHVPLEELMNGGTEGALNRTSWDPRSDDSEQLLEKLGELHTRNAQWLSLIRVLPPEALPNRAMLANFVDSLVGGACPTAAERLHDLIELLQQRLAAQGEEFLEYIIPLRDLYRLPERRAPYDGFSTDEVILLLDTLKREWVRHRDLRIIAAPEESLFPDVKLELASNIGFAVVGREAQVRCRRDLRIDWTEDRASVAFARDCLLRVKRSAGFGPRDRPTMRDVERVIDDLLSRVDGEPSGPIATSPLRVPRFVHRVAARAS